MGPDQIHASPIWADNKLHLPLFDGSVHVIKDHGEHAEVLSKINLGHACLASPAVAQGKVFIGKKQALLLWTETSPTPFKPKSSNKTSNSEKISSLQIVPSEFSLMAGQKIKFRVFGLDANGHRIIQLGDGLKWEKWIPPTAKVKAELDGNLSTSGPGSLFALPTAKLSAGLLGQVTEN